MFILSVINKKIKVLTQQTNDEFERFKQEHIKKVREEQKQSNNRLDSQSRYGINGRKRKAMNQSTKQFTSNDCLDNFIRCCSRSSK